RRRVGAIALDRRFGDFRNAGEGADDRGGLDRQDQGLLVRRGRERFKGADIFVGDEVVEGGEIAARDGFGDRGGGFRLGLGGAFAALGIAERGLAAAFCLENLRLLLALGAEDFGLPLAFGFQNCRALLTLGLHLARHGGDEILRRANVLDL